MLAFRIVFGVLMLGAFVSANVYLYRRLVRDVTDHPWIRKVAAGAMALSFLAVPLVRFAFRGSLPPATATTVVLLWWGVTIYTLLALIAAEVVRGVLALRTPPKVAAEASSGLPIGPTVEAPPKDDAELSRRKFIARATAAGALAVGGGFTAFGSYRAFTPPEVTEVPLRLPGLPRSLDGFTIVQLSDIHVGPVIQERFLDQLVSAANGARPDLVAITGDLVDGKPDQLGHFVARLKNLRSRYGTYFVSGNHDYYSGWEDWAPLLPGVGFTVLRNRFVTIGDAGGSFDLIGVDDYGSRWGSGGYDLDAATAGRDPERASVLLAHQPNGLELVSEKRIGLQLSGHTHGGQMFPGTLIGEVIWGSRNAGLSRHGATHLYTSRGCGFVGPPVRVGAPPEVVKIVLLAG
ncbi:MAG: metallophosphoesterase [Myxococcota bacterium]